MMKLEKNDRKSCGTKFKTHTHNIFIHENILVKETIELMLRPTNRMVIDFYTKLLQGSLLGKMSDIVMGLNPFPEEAYVINSEQTREID